MITKFNKLKEFFFVILAAIVITTSVFLVIQSLISREVNVDKKNKKLPFIPYLTISWMLIFTLN